MKDIELTRDAIVICRLAHHRNGISTRKCVEAMATNYESLSDRLKQASREMRDRL